MAYKRSDPVIYSILKFSEGYLKKIKIDSVSFAVPSTRVEHVKIKTRNKIAAGKKQPLWYLMCYFNLTGVCICWGLKSSPIVYPVQIAKINIEYLFK